MDQTKGDGNETVNSKAHAPTPTPSLSNGDKEDLPPEPVSDAVIHPTRMWLMTSNSEVAMKVRHDLEILMRRLAYLNSPQGQQIFKAFEQHIRDWALVVEELTRVEGRFARDNDDLIPEDPDHARKLVLAGRAIVQSALKAFRRYRTLQDMATTVEGVFIHAETFKSALSDDLKICDSAGAAIASLNCLDDGSQPTSSRYPLHCKQLEIIDGVMDRVAALSDKIGQKLTQMGV